MNTYQDIKQLYEECNDLDSFGAADDLRDAAIEWIKTNENNLYYCYVCNCIIDDWYVHNQKYPSHDINLHSAHTNIWIKHFFNLTEEDLK